MITSVAFMHAYALLLVLFRTAGLCMVAPILGTKVVPARVRLALSLAGAVVAYLGGGSPTLALPSSFLAIAGHALSESAVGLSAGLGARLMLDAATATGQLAAQGMGFGYSATLDPLMGVESTFLGEFFSQITVMFAVAFGLHREAFAWLAHSVHSLPPGAIVDLNGLGAGLITHILSSMTLAVRMGFPILIAVTFGHLGLAVVGRVAPQLNLSNVGFSIAILVGGGALYLLMPDIASHLARAALASFSLSSS